MEFSFVTLYVKDLEASLSFYRDAIGLAVLRRQETANGALAFVGAPGQPNIELLCTPDNREGCDRGFSLGFRVDSLERAQADLEARGVRKLRGPVEPGSGVRFSFFAGPDGEEIQLIEYL
ncbi:MAG: VOC family protein [Clostridiales bacterium]|nr:VOC family protein [Clostridiales bacterium]